MPFDFPNSPSSGQQFTPAGGPTYQWNGTGWIKVTTGQGIGAVAFVSDIAPPVAGHGSLWYESDTGVLYMRYDDGNSQQWVQVSSPAGSQILEAPSDGKEYVRINGVWRVKSEIVDLTGASQGAPKTLQIPNWAKFYRLQGEVYIGQNGFVQMQVSVDGVNWINGASDYQTAGMVHNTGSSGYANYPTSGTPAYLLTVTGDNALLAQSFNVRGQVVGVPTKVYGAIDIEGSVLDAGAGTQMRHFIARAWLNLTVPAGGNRVQALRFFPNFAPAGFAAGSQMTVEWS
jgi:hypothetical protein